MEHRVYLSLYGEISEASAKQFGQALRDQQRTFPRAKEVLVLVDSCGGDPQAGELLIARELRRRFDYVKFKVNGLAGSAALDIAIAAGDEIEMCAGAVLHTHAGNGCGGNRFKHCSREHLCGDCRWRDYSAITRMARRSGQDEDTVRGWMERGTWFNAEDALRLNLADKIDTREPLRSVYSLAGKMGPDGMY